MTNTYRSIKPAFIIHGQISSRENPFYRYDTYINCCDFHDAWNIKKRGVGGEVFFQQTAENMRKLRTLKLQLRNLR